jgi:hypothetical protein
MMYLFLFLKVSLRPMRRSSYCSMTPEVSDLLKPLAKGKLAQDFLFTSANADQVLDFRVSWRKMCKAAKVSILLRDFRRPAVRNMTSFTRRGQEKQRASNRFNVQPLQRNGRK